MTIGKNDQMKQKLTISLSGDDDIAAILELRSLLEKRLKQHLSIVQVVKCMTKITLDQERALEAWPKAAE
jgi:hypothetical protein